MSQNISIALKGLKSEYFKDNGRKPTIALLDNKSYLAFSLETEREGFFDYRELKDRNEYLGMKVYGCNSIYEIIRVAR